MQINTTPLSLMFSPINYTEIQFEERALELFRYQAAENKTYATFIKHLGVKPKDVKRLTEIPFLPVEFFKHKKITDGSPISKTFSSSGTTGSTPSCHHVADVSVYEKSFTKAFEYFYDSIDKFCVLALLPGYLEREGSSLVYMVDNFIGQSQYSQSGFYLYNHTELAKMLETNEAQGIPTLLIGVTFGLLDFAEKHQFQLKNTIVMETGGMKGRRREMLREEVHTLLCNSFGVATIHSEYGMTELLSQAYSKGNGIYSTPPWMKVLNYDIYNPLYTSLSGKGGLNVIDLANIHSCAFIQTQDIGVISADNTFEVLGRFDSSDIRGCNLMVM
ncbi:MAG: acyltransferase [Salinivirgaceae bacterium]